MGEVVESREGWSLPGGFYFDLEVYRLDLEQIWRRGWLFAAHSCEIRRPGDYVTLEVDTDPVVLVRGEDGVARAFHNVCRHRGSLVCVGETGRSTRLVCPYHQWAYGLDGELIACRGMGEGFEKRDFGLHLIHTREVEGLIYLNLAREPIPFGPAEEVLSAQLRPQGLNRAKVAKTVNYFVKANWKLVWENNRECYHCNVNHPQYIRANFDHYNADDTTARIQEEIQWVVKRAEEKWAAAGLAPSHKQTGMTQFPDAANNIWYSANRTALVEGYVSETMSGKQAAPLMGAYPDADVGTLRVRTLPNFWNHSSCDHTVSTRLLPAGPVGTRIQVSWLVHEEAVEGKDYRLEDLLPFWQLTSEQDWEICERQQKGVSSSAYSPGPYSSFKEYNVNGFIQWYRQMLQKP